MGIFTDILAFIVAIGVLVTVHEFGHFWVARRLGVKVLRFSVGFGRRLWTRQDRYGTEFAISAIPLGGYVKMLDEREAEVPAAERHRAFNSKPLWARNAVVFAGPAFNFLFAVLAYWAIFVVGTTELKPVVGTVAADSPAAAAGFETGDEILAVDGEETVSWNAALMALLDAGVGESQLAVTVRSADGTQTTRQLDVAAVGPLGEDPDVLRALGLRPWVPEIPAEIGQVLPDGAAAAAGIQAGDRVEALAGEPVATWQELVRRVQARPGEAVTVTVRRDGRAHIFDVRLDSRQTNDGRIGMLGVSPQVPQDLYDGMRRTIQYGPLASVPRAVEATWGASALTVKMLWHMVTGEASMKNLSGPINIAQYAGDSVTLGIAPFLKFLAIVSISLGILNLLPVPVLDGGHLLYNGIEWVRGQPLSDQAQGVGQQIGVGLLVMLMAVAFYNDLVRLFGPG